MTTTERPATPAPYDDETGSPDAAPGAAPKLLEQMGGPRGFVYSTIPVVAFVTANVFLPLVATLVLSLGTGLALTVFRMVTGEKLASALGSLIGVGVAAGVVAATGSAKDFFLVGIYAALAGFVVALGSVLVRRPLTGVVWNALHGGSHSWRDTRSVLRAHDIATTAAAAVFGARFMVTEWLYLADSTTGLGIAKVATGTPLTVLAALVVIWAFRRSSARLVR